ncbi:MAG TPA: ABC transporter ATP-binding protein, partial [Firmicutes bacterium]|nr:ABC transporter ATP-binding protein [Bacillota bacterium]
MPLLKVIDLKKVYTTRFGGHPVQALANVSFTVEQGEFVAVMGESGAGKTTLLNIIAGFDKPTSGDVLLNGKSIVSIDEKEMSAF